MAEERYFFSALNHDGRITSRNYTICFNFLFYFRHSTRKIANRTWRFETSYLFLTFFQRLRKYGRSGATPDRYFDLCFSTPTIKCSNKVGWVDGSSACICHSIKTEFERKRRRINNWPQSNLTLVEVKVGVDKKKSRWT